MVEVVKKYYCDLCKKEGAKEYRTFARFHTEQTEGRMVKPYLTVVKIDLCENCIEKVVVLNGEGCQGNNRFWIDKD